MQKSTYFYTILHKTTQKQKIAKLSRYNKSLEFSRLLMVLGDGIEPPTRGFSELSFTKIFLLKFNKLKIANKALCKFCAKKIKVCTVPIPVLAYLAGPAIPKCSEIPNSSLFPARPQRPDPLSATPGNSQSLPSCMSLSSSARPALGLA